MTVYYIRADNGAIKIGYTSNDINKRLQALSTSSPLDLELIAYEDGGLNLEKQRHDEYSQFNIRGEWFIPSDKLNEKIKELSPNYEPFPYLDKSDYLDMMLEKNKASKKLENINSWYAVNRKEPPKICYPSLLICTLYTVFVFHLMEPMNASEEFITGMTVIFYPLMLPGIILGHVWYTKRVFSYLR